jgi:hypothetical protein
MRFRRKRALRWIADAIVALGGTVFNIVIARILGQVGNSNDLPGFSSSLPGGLPKARAVGQCGDL